jgi:hypothetical protein
VNDARPCTLCGQECGPLYLCDWDSRSLAGRLASLPGLVAELAEHLVPRRAGLAERVAAGPAGPRSPLNETVIDLVHGGHIALVLESWRTDVQRVRWPDHGAPPAQGGMDQRVMAACRWLAMELDWITGHYEQAGELAREVRALESSILGIVGDPPPRPKPVGQCIAVTDDTGTVCGATITHLAGQSRLTCRRCSTVYRTEQDLLLLLHYQPKETA